jgi:hypothetical protein
MKAIAVLLLFIGMFLIIQGYYNVEKKCEKPQVKIQYIPMSLYEEQLSSDPKLSISSQFKGMFEDINPWPKTTG